MALHFLRAGIYVILTVKDISLYAMAESLTEGIILISQVSAMNLLIILLSSQLKLQKIMM